MKIENIENPEFLKGLSISEKEQLAYDLRSFLIHSVSKTGGHLSSNLGIVELTIALHSVFNTPYDKLIFDVGHQAYIHKLLTGRASKFNTLRTFDGISGFQKLDESEYDCWEAGHSSTSLSAALGMAVARDLNKQDYSVVPIIGDGSLFNGMSFEALNHIGYAQPNMTIIFNDNNMSISKNIGGLTNSLTKLRTSKPYMIVKDDLKDILNQTKSGHNVLMNMKKIKDFLKNDVIDSGIFNEFNIDYLGPIDGHNINDLEKSLEVCKNHIGPIVLHVITKKGKGYSYAENDTKGIWHGIGPFNMSDGKLLSKSPLNHKNWSLIISESLCQLASTNNDIICVTPAMISGSKLENFFEKFPERAFDCGIAEEHATTFCASLALSNKKPFLSIYSSFLQRAYDQINHDICRMNLNVVIGIDRAGLVGEDGETHHGVYDISILSSLPNIVICQPKDSIEAQQLLFTGFNYNGPFAIRYPRGNSLYKKVDFKSIEIGTWTKEIFDTSNSLTIITYGPDINIIKNRITNNNLNINLINARFIKPFDKQMINELVKYNKPVIFYETDVLSGGLSSLILQYLCDTKQYLDITRIGIKDNYVKQGSLNLIKKENNIDIDTLFETVYKII